MKFEVDSAETTGGRRVVVHEFPLRDRPQTEDMGRKATGYSFDAYVIGADYMAQRDQLIEALENPDPGTLVHPYYGELRIQVGEVRWVESTREGGMCRFTIQFHEASDIIFELPLEDTLEGVTSSADVASEASNADFADTFSVAGQGASRVDDVLVVAGAITEQITSVLQVVDMAEADLATVTDLVDQVSSEISELILVPVDFSDAITRALSSMRAAIARPGDAFQALRRLFDFGADLAEVPTDTPAGQQQADNQAALTQMLRAQATIEAARAASAAQWASAEEAIAARDALTAQVDNLVEADIADSVYGVLVALRAACSRDLTTRSAQLPHLVDIKLQDTLPSLTLAWQLYADATRAQELVDRNRMADPLFVPAGVSLEALDE